MIAFWDSSAIVPLCITQPASAWSESLLEIHPQVFVWWGTTVEVSNGIVRSHRAASLAANLRTGAIQVLENLASAWEEIPPSERIRELAIQNVLNFDLRAADAFQLAAALEWCEEDTAGHRFICNDRRLSDAASSLGFEVVSYY